MTKEEYLLLKITNRMERLEMRQKDNRAIIKKLLRKEANLRKKVPLF